MDVDRHFFIEYGIDESHTELWCEDCEKWLPFSEWEMSETYCESCGGHDVLIHGDECEGWGYYDSYSNSYHDRHLTKNGKTR